MGLNDFDPRRGLQKEAASAQRADTQVLYWSWKIHSTAARGARGADAHGASDVDPPNFERMQGRDDEARLENRCKHVYTSWRPRPSTLQTRDFERLQGRDEEARGRKGAPGARLTG